jgi:putative transposase
MQYRRLYNEGGCYFFTLVTFERRPIFRSPESIALLRTAFRALRADRPFEIDAAVILPDHLHCIWRLPIGDSDFSNRIKSIKKRFTIAYEGEAGKVWQKRFWEHLIRDEDDWRRHMDYVHYNPVKHGYSDSPSKWPYSFFRRCVEKGFYASDWGSDISDSVLKMDRE